MPPTSKRARRLAKESAAAAFVEQHHGPMAELLQKVSGDLAAELVGVPMAHADARLAAEMAFRLDNAIAIPNELAEALDWFGFFLASLAVIGIWRAIERKEGRKHARLDKLMQKLTERGPRMTRARRRALERRIARLQAD